MFKKLLVLPLFLVSFNAVAMAPTTPPRNPNAGQQAPDVRAAHAAARNGDNRDYTAHVNLLDHLNNDQIAYLAAQLGNFGLGASATNNSASRQ